MGVDRVLIPHRLQQKIIDRKEGSVIPTALRGFGSSGRDAIARLGQRFGTEDFFYQDAIEQCQIDPKVFAKLRSDGVLIKIGKHWPVRWRISRRYLTQNLSGLFMQNAEVM